MSDEYLEKEDQHSDYKPVDAKKEGVKHQLTGIFVPGVTEPRSGTRFGLSSALPELDAGW